MLAGFYGFTLTLYLQKYDSMPSQAINNKNTNTRRVISMNHPLLDNCSIVNTFDEHTVELISAPHGLVVVTGSNVEKNLTAMALIRGYLGDATKYGKVIEVGETIYPDVNHGIIFTPDDNGNGVKEIAQEYFHEEDVHVIIIESVDETLIPLALQISLVGGLAIISFESQDNHSAMDHLIRTIPLK